MTSAMTADHRYVVTLRKDTPLAGAAFLSAAAAYATERSIQPLNDSEIVHLSRNSINGFDRSATSRYSERTDAQSDILVVATMAAPLLLFTDQKTQGDWVPVSTMYIEVLLASYSLPAFGKFFSGRARPYVFNPAVPLDKKRLPEARESFFSRHTCFAFASSAYFSSIYCSYHPQSRFGPYLVFGSLAVAATTGYMRYEAGCHFPTDIITGAIAGSLIGYGVPYFHQSKKSPVRLAINPLKPDISILYSW